MKLDNLRNNDIERENFERKIGNIIIIIIIIIYIYIYFIVFNILYI